jgi:hypothetical protein
MEAPVISNDVLARHARDAAQEVARRVQERFAEYLERTPNREVGSVDVFAERVGAPPARQ